MIPVIGYADSSLEWNDYGEAFKYSKGEWRRMPHQDLDTGNSRYDSIPARKEHHRKVHKTYPPYVYPYPGWTKLPGYGVVPDLYIPYN